MHSAALGKNVVLDSDPRHLFDEVVDMSSINGVLGPVLSFDRAGQTTECVNEGVFTRTRSSTRMFSMECVVSLEKKRARSDSQMLSTEYVESLGFKRPSSVTLQEYELFDCNTACI